MAVEVEHGGGAMLLLLRLQARGCGGKGAEVGWHARRGGGGKPTSGHKGKLAGDPASQPGQPSADQITCARQRTGGRLGWWVGKRQSRRLGALPAKPPVPRCASAPRLSVEGCCRRCYRPQTWWVEPPVAR